MKIRGFRLHRLSVPLPRHYVSGMHDYRATENVLLELDAGDAIGHGHAFAFVPAHADAIRTLVSDLAETLVGRDVGDVRAIYAELLRRINFIGAGPGVMALAMIDTALWDILGQEAELPLYRLLGASRSEVPVYASGGWFTDSIEDMAQEARTFADQGFAGYKIKVGHDNWRLDVERVEYLLSAVGNRINVMIDANQAWSVQDSIARGRVFAELGVVWFEEPVSVHDVEGSARVAAALTIPLASGETVFTRHGFRPMIEQRAADVLMINVVRCGGPSEFLYVAAQAEAANLPVSSHTLTEISAHLMAAIPNATLVEYIPGWWDELFEGAPTIENGVVKLSDRPGLGFQFADRAIREYAVESGTT